MASRLGLVGLGLVGGSIAAAVRAADRDVVIVGVDRRDVIDEARRRNLIDDARETAAALDDVDLIVLATPVPDVLATIAALGRAGLSIPVTDVASTKRQIVAAAGKAGIDFVGGHPMAGSEHSGLAHATAELFRGRAWLVVPTGSAAARAEVEWLVRMTGSTAREVDADVHDRAMAYVSHLPQLLAVALADAAGRALDPSALAMAGRGFADMTRLASSPPDLWHGILSSNADFVGEALTALRAALDEIDEVRVDSTALATAFARAHGRLDAVAGGRA